MPPQSLPPPGFSRADLHVHTTYSDGIATPEDVLNYYALHSGSSVLAITDHDTIDGALHARRHAEKHPDLYGHLELVVGEEVSSRDGHVLGLFLERWIPPGMDAGRTVAAIHAQGGIAIAPHPYTSWMRWAGLVGVGDLIREVPFDAVETRNSNFTEVFSNRKAERNAGDKARVGSSDGHFLGAMGRSYTDFPGRTAEDLRRAVRERTTVAGGGCYGLVTLLRYVCHQVRVKGSIWPRRRDFKLEAAVGGLEIKVHRESGISAVVLTPAGRLDALSMPELKEKVKLLAEAKLGIVLDLSETSALDAAGVTALVAGMKRARENGVGFCLAAVPPHCARVLGPAGLLRVFPRAATVRDARRRVAAAGRVPAEVLAEEKEIEILGGAK
ncbi:MAG: STAS domain-containing protein [Planctomycetes bacterium]|nr:STAS domain-containing protein [Planctomycetota bacterium]